MRVARKRCQGMHIRALRPGGDLLRANALARCPRMIRLQAWPRNPCLDASGTAAPADGAWMLIGIRPGQRVVAPFAANSARPVDQGTLAHEPTPAAGAEDHAEHALSAGPGAVHGLRQRKAVGVVGKPHQAARRCHRAWNANPDACRSARTLLEEAHHVSDGPHGGPVVVARRWSAMLAQRAPGRPKRYACDLGAAQIDANAQARRPGRFVGHAPWL